MIGKPAWFQRRKYGGWGLSPKTWQGWMYIFVFLTPLIIVNSLSLFTSEIRSAFSIVWVGLLILDVVHIMANLNNDEREYKIEAISERNSAWAMVFVLGVGIIYQSFKGSFILSDEFGGVDPFLLITLAIGVLAKAVSNIYYSKKSL
jgi:hypothetical protein